MIHAQLTRQDLASILSEDLADPSNMVLMRSEMIERPPERRTTWAFWNDDPTPRSKERIPCLLVVNDDEQLEFLAWAAAFLGSFRPLTAFVKVWSWSSFEMAQDISPLRQPFPLAPLIGAIFGEALINAGNFDALRTLPTSAFESTYFAAIGQGLVTNANGELLIKISEGWIEARDLTEQPNRKVSTKSLQNVSLVLSGLSPGSRIGRVADSWTFPVIAACNELSDTGTVSHDTLRVVSRERLPSIFLSETATMSKERRVEQFELLARFLSTSEDNDPMAGFLVGYLASKVSGGSLDHANLIFAVEEKFPSAMLWYGICSGLTPRNTVRSGMGNLGVRVARSIFRKPEIFAPTNCDISVEELRILFRADAKGRAFRQSLSSALRVEIAPNVSTLVRWPNRQSGSDQLGLFPAEDDRIQPDSEKIGDLIRFLRISLGLAEGFVRNTRRDSESTSSAKGKKRRTTTSVQSSSGASDRRSIGRDLGVQFPDGDIEGGVHQILRVLLRMNGEETEASLPRAIQHNLSATNRYIDYAEGESLLRRDQVRMAPGVKLTDFGRKYAAARGIY